MHSNKFESNFESNDIEEHLTTQTQQQAKEMQLISFLKFREGKHWVDDPMGLRVKA